MMDWKWEEDVKKKVVIIPILRFSHIWLYASYEAQNFQSSFYIFGYLLERIIAVWWYFFFLTDNPPPQTSFSKKI